MSTLSLLAAALKLLPLFLKLISQFKASADARVQRGLGRSEAEKEAYEEVSRRVQLAHEVEIEAEKEHAAKPGDDAFDQDFMRKDGA